MELLRLRESMERFLTLMLICLSTTSGSKSYEGYQVLSLLIADNDVLANFIHFQSIHNDVYDNWLIRREGNNTRIDLSVAPSGLHNLTSFLQRHSIPSTVVIQNLQDQISDERRSNDLQRLFHLFRTHRGSEHDAYKTVDEINEVIDRYQRKYDFVQVETLGTTFEGREIRGLRICKNHKKKMIFIDAGIHAREWITPAASLYFVDRLLRGDQEILDSYQFYVVPLLNPDGYHFSHTKERLWRKNRSPAIGGDCIGVDLNRNFPLKWGVSGISDNPCSDVYAGSGPASELESQALMNKLSELKDQIILYLNLHSFGQFILTPYGFARYTYTNNYKKMLKLGKMVRNEIQRRYNYIYRVGSSADLLYEASGGVDDYVAGVLKVPYSYTIELCDEGRYGFVLPPSYIRTVGRQVWVAVKVFVHHM